MNSPYWISCINIDPDGVVVVVVVVVCFRTWCARLCVVAGAPGVFV